MPNVGRSDMVEDLMRVVRGVSRAPRHVYDLIVYVFRDRHRFTESYRFMAHSPAYVAVVLRETAGVEPRRIAEADGRTGMAKELMTAFLDAAERVRREEAWGDAYEADAENDDDTFAEASALEAGSRWHEAT